MEYYIKIPSDYLMVIWDTKDATHRGQSVGTLYNGQFSLGKFDSQLFQ